MKQPIRKPSKQKTVARRKRRPAADRATRELHDLAETLREDARKMAKDRSLRGHSQRSLNLAADVLDRVAMREDARVLFDGRVKEMPKEKAVYSILEAAFSGEWHDWTDAILSAAVDLGLSQRTVERHWEQYLKDIGHTRESYVFPHNHGKTKKARHQP